MKLWAGSLLLALAVAQAARGAERPNILFIYTDDQAAWALGASGNEQALTPNMDRLAREGVRLANAFTTTPVCSPSRAGLIASRYGSELGITDWIHPQSEPKLGLDPAVTAFPEVLAAAGYRTGLVGKWHLGTPDALHPQYSGYQHFMGFREGGVKTSNPRLEKAGEVRKFEGLTEDILTDHALEFLRARGDAPFLLSLHFRAPHSAYLPVAPEDAAPYKDRELKIPNPDYPDLNAPRVKKLMGEYLSSVRAVDRNLGRLLAALEELKLADNTVVIFTSDHGYNIGHNGVFHKGNGHWIVNNPPAATKNIPKGQRPNMYDTSLRVPALVRWPGKLPAGRVVEETVSNLDWYPTLVALGGGELPKGEMIRGRDFLPLLRGEKLQWDNALYAEYSTHHQSRTQMRVYRTPEWKLIRDFLNPGRDELYHLAEDPEERNNLIDDPRAEVQEIVKTLHAKILERMEKIGDPLAKETKHQKTSTKKQTN